ncbi:MAG: Phosphomannomutase/phosphoglucomutase [candidate division TM6 bacterium GW2011_GWF2_32_72]|nr:MAG: Phosphomannomutase/phosphoglucomutase [candidate division TM6 bacterium GW2011_GWF2_32_72]
MKDHVFKQYDIRGKIGSEIDLDQVYDLGCAIAFYLKQQSPSVQRIVVGMDGRDHSPIIKKHLCSALVDSGLDVVFLGLCPSPLLYFSFTCFDVDAGLMITASHNPAEYNGIKIRLGDHSIWGTQIQEIKKCFYEKNRIEAFEKGEYCEKSVTDVYINWMVANFKHLKGLDLKILFDCGNAVAGIVMPKLIEKMGWKNTKVLFAEIDGSYPNHEADPTVEENMADAKKVLLQEGFDLAIGFDGDADRMAPLTKTGELVPGDKLMGVFSKYASINRRNFKVVYDIKCSSALSIYLSRLGIKSDVAPSGHSLIKNKMKEIGAHFGGELSCHFFFNDRYFGYDDGIYAMMRLLEILHSTHKSLDLLLEEFPKMICSKEFRIECLEEQKQKIVDDVTGAFAIREDVELLLIDGIKANCNYGSGLLRASNTQSVICLRFESVSQEGLEKVKNDFVNCIKPYFEESFLTKNIEI